MASQQPEDNGVLVNRIWRIDQSYLLAQENTPQTDSSSVSDVFFTYRPRETYFISKYSSIPW